MLGLLIALLIIDALLLVAVILLQPGRDQGLTGIAGSSYATTLLGGRGSVEFLTRATIVLSVILVALIIGINFYISTERYSAPAMERSVPTMPVPASPTGE